MRTIFSFYAMLVTWMLLVALPLPAHAEETEAQEPEPTTEELVANVVAMVNSLAEDVAEVVEQKAAETAPVAAQPAPAPKEATKAPKERHPVQVNMPHRQVINMDACGVKIEGQPVNGNHLEDMMALSESCQRTAMDAGMRRVEVVGRVTLAAAAIDADRNFFAEGDQVAVGQAATYAAMGDNVGLGLPSGDSVAWANSRMNGLRSLEAIRNQGMQQTPQTDEKEPIETPSAPSVPTTPTPSAKERVEKALSEAME